MGLQLPGAIEFNINSQKEIGEMDCAYSSMIHSM